jgi:hypothetical protein
MLKSKAWLAILAGTGITLAIYLGLAVIEFFNTLVPLG